MGEGDVQIVIAIDDDRLGRTPLLVIDPATVDPATVIDISEPKTLSGWQRSADEPPESGVAREGRSG
jgi:hypothetical protein